jgi:hypothetical protein
VGSEFTTILDADQIRCRRRLFMTATPRYHTSRLRREAGVLDVEVASMDDEATFGPVLHHLSFGEGIERDLLSDFYSSQGVRPYASCGQTSRSGTRSVFPIFGESPISAGGPEGRAVRSGSCQAPRRPWAPWAR